jgi:serine protease AprX
MVYRLNYKNGSAGDVLANPHAVMMHSFSLRTARRKAVWGPKRTLVAVAVAVLALSAEAFAAATSQPGGANSNAHPYRLDHELSKRAVAGNASATTRVIVEWQPGATVPAAFKPYARRNGTLNLLNGSVLDLPNGLLGALAQSPSVLRVHHDRPAFKHDFRTNDAIGARAVQQALGYTGAGVGVAVIDSGITAWHDDLTSRFLSAYPYGNQRVSAFVDFVSGFSAPYDDDGHGTHVAGIIAGNGYDSNGRNAGVAPDASLVVLKALDANGGGTISTVIQALDWVLANHAQYNIRIVNLSVGAAIRESYWTDPLTLAAKRLVDAGIVVVAAAGNLGNNDQGHPQYGGIGAPANAPWVLTVGASSTNGTTGRADDAMASFSSRGPTYLDWAAKPDLVAPGVGTVSLASPGSSLYVSRPQALLPGSTPAAALPYLSLSGTSMAAPVVSGTIALMLQANPSLTPNAVKAILQYTAQTYAGYDPLTEGAGFLNAVGAIRLTRFYATAQAGQTVPTQAMWSRHIIWGNHQLTGGLPVPGANAFSLGTIWGTAFTSGGDNIVWGTLADGDNIVWGTAIDGDNIVWGTAANGDNIVWGTDSGNDNIVWGTDCGGGDCDNIVWGTLATLSDGDNIVWGTSGLDADNIVWGTARSDDNIVWGTLTDGDNIVWGTADSGLGDNIVWGTLAPLTGADNIVWGTLTGGDNIVWGTADSGLSVLWDSATATVINWDTLGGLFPRLSDEQIFYVLGVLTSTPLSTTSTSSTTTGVVPMLSPIVPFTPAPEPSAPLLSPVPAPTLPVAPTSPGLVPAPPSVTPPAVPVPLVPTLGGL